MQSSCQQFLGITQTAAPELVSGISAYGKNLTAQAWKARWNVCRSVTFLNSCNRPIARTSWVYSDPSRRSPLLAKIEYGTVEQLLLNRLYLNNDYDETRGLVY